MGWTHVEQLGWHMGWMMLWWILLLAILGGIVWMIATAVQRRIPMGGDHDAEAILKRRYARGEIDRDEYERVLEDLHR